MKAPPSRLIHVHRLTWLVAIIILSVGLRSAPFTLPVAAQATGSQYTLTMADNGSTVSVVVGDTIVLRLGSSTLYTWELALSNPNILRRPPLALIQGTQGIWTAIAPGQTTLSATGTPVCYPQCLAPSYALGVTIVVRSALPPGPGTQITYPAGWNLIGVSAGSTVPVDTYAWDPAISRYVRVAAGTVLQAGGGYWAYFTTQTAVTLLPTGSDVSAHLSAPAGSWILVGNPSDRAPATILGGDAVFAWDPVGSRYTAVRTVLPGQGAWAFSATGGTITITTSG